MATMVNINTHDLSFPCLLSIKLMKLANLLRICNRLSHKHVWNTCCPGTSKNKAKCEALKKNAIKICKHLNDFCIKFK